MRIGNKTSRLIVNHKFTVDATLIKAVSGSYVNGLYVVTNPTETPVKISKHKASTDDRTSLPEGANITEAITVYIQSTDRDYIRPVRTGDGIQTTGDIFRIDNINYEVYHVNNNTLFKHIKCVCMRQDNQDG